MTERVSAASCSRTKAARQREGWAVPVRLRARPQYGALL